MKVYLVGKVTLDQQGLSTVLTGAPVRSMVNDVASRVASNARGALGGRARVEVQSYIARGGRLIGDRAAASVRITGRDSTGLEAKYGVLTQAVAALGLQISHR